jgi:hypothetical protein
MTTKVVDVAEQIRLNEAREAPVPLGMGGLSVMGAMVASGPDGVAERDKGRPSEGTLTA